jgi:YebC/PmpR family DNA-binding regulatory protein
MSRHSKWAKIKHQKGAEDIKRGAIFTKLARSITAAAKEGGGDPTTNFKLRLAMDQARALNMPKENIERAIKRGTGELADGTKIETVLYEGFLPGGIALIIEALTDNKNRTASIVKHLLNKYDGNLGLPNSVAWMFEKKGVARISNYKNFIPNLDDFQLKMIDLGADDFQIEEDDLIIYTKPENLQKISEELEKEKITPEYTLIELVAKEKINITDPATKEKIENFLNELDENEEIDNYYTNLEEF